MEREQQLSPSTCRLWGGEDRRQGGDGDSATCTRSGEAKGPRLQHSRARPAHVGSRGCSPRVKFYQRSVPVEQGIPFGGWVSGQELSSLEPVQNRVSGGRRNNPVERKESRCFRETLQGKSAGEPSSWKCQTRATAPAPNRASSYCAGTLRALQAAPAAGRRGTAGSTCSWALGSSKQGQSLISLQMKPGVQLLVGAGAQPCPDTFQSSRMSSLWAVSQSSGCGRAESCPQDPPVLPVTLSPSHRPAVLDAALGRNARPGQEAAEEALGLSVYPLGNGARAQAGQCGANVL